MKKAVLLAIVLALTGCATSLFDKARGITTGMPEAELIALMGAPTARVAGPGGVGMSWGRPGQIVTVLVRDGKVVRAPQLPS